MALINCPECGRKVSDKAVACPDCGYPVAALNTGGATLIKIGDILSATGMTGAAARATTTVLLLDYSTQAELSSGKIGSVIKVKIDEPQHVILRIKGFMGATLYDGIIEPNKRYELVKLPALFIAKWALNEIDAIDSGL